MKRTRKKVARHLFLKTARCPECGTRNPKTSAVCRKCNLEFYRNIDMVPAGRYEEFYESWQKP